MARVGRKSPAEMADSANWVGDVLNGTVRSAHGGVAVAAEFTYVTARYLDMTPTVHSPGPDADLRGLSTELCMSRQTLLRTVRGERWLTLPDSDAALHSVRIGAAFRTRDSRLRDFLLHRMNHFRPPSAKSLASGTSHDTLTGSRQEREENSMMPPDVVRRKFEDLVALVRELGHAHQDGRLPVRELPFTDRDWRRIRALVEGDQQITGLARLALSDEEVWTVTEVRRYIEQHGRWISQMETGRTLGSLKDRGEAEHVTYRTYRKRAPNADTPPDGTP